VPVGGFHASDCVMVDRERFMPPVVVKPSDAYPF